MNRYIIDCMTTAVNRNISVLKRLKTTHSVSNGGMYREDHSYSQIHLESDMTEEQLDRWFYHTIGVEAVGIVAEGAMA